LKERLGGELDANKIAAMDSEELVAVFCQKPALHRFPASMGRRAHDMCGAIAHDYDGDAARVWESATTGDELFARLRALPGYGDEKSKIFVAILAKRMGVKPKGWEEVAGPFADPEPRSVADIDSPEALEKVRQWKKAKKAAGKTKQD
jgi:uncharacterized HhH-GPD family protein